MKTTTVVAVLELDDERCAVESAELILNMKRFLMQDNVCISSVLGIVDGISDESEIFLHGTSTACLSLMIGIRSHSRVESWRKRNLRLRNIHGRAM